MKKLFFLFIFCGLSVITAKAQVVKDTTVFTVVEKMPEFPGGEAAMNQYLIKNLQYPEMARDKGIEGKVWLEFVIDEEGYVTNVEVIRGIGGGCDQEALRVLKKMPKWSPGTQKGKPVKVKYRLPIIFNLQ